MHDEGDLRRRFDGEVSRGEPGALFVAEADHLSSVADFWGRAVADAVLVAFAERIAGALPIEEPPVRGREGRVLALRRLSSAKEALAFAQRLRTRIADRPFEIPDGRDAVFLTASIGIALRFGGGSATFAQLEAAAVAALEDARRAGGNRVVLAG